MSWFVRVGLLTRRDCYGPSVRGWVVLVGVSLVVALIMVCSINPFLSVSQPVPADVLIVESWLPDYAMFSAVGEFRRGGYKYVIASGGTLPDAGPLSRYKTGAEFGAAKLVELGLQAEVVIPVSSEPAGRDRTYASGMAVKRWLQVNHGSLTAVDVYSLGAHARRSRLLFQKALGSSVKVGIIACPDSYYDSRRWWASSEGVRTVTGEGLAYVYARFIFPLLPHKTGRPINPKRDTRARIESQLTSAAPQIAGRARASLQPRA